VATVVSKEGSKFQQEVKKRTEEAEKKTKERELREMEDAEKREKVALAATDTANTLK
jgi:hypothetical protein